MTAFGWRVPAALLASALTGVAIAAAVGSAAPARPGEVRAQALAGANRPQFAGAPYRGAQARVAAGARAAAVPLPPGGTFNGIQWEVDGGDWAAGDVEGILEYNAACQWLRAWRDGRDATTALTVLSAAPDWPAMRGTESGRFLTQVAADARAGGGRTATEMLADCDASHTREVATATRLGLTPSR
jgi:hypothetical protein